MFYDKSNQQGGFGTVEIIIVSALVITMTLAVSAALVSVIRLGTSSSNQMQAFLRIDESAEALQIMRDTSWSSSIGAATIGTTYYLERLSNSYALSSTQPTSEDYYTEVVVDEVRRDMDGVLDDNGDVDSDSLQAVVSVYRTADAKFLTDGEFLIHNVYEN